MRIVPSIDLLDGAAVQLVNGRPEALRVRENNLSMLVERFAPLQPINVIDLDAALGQGDNRATIRQLAQQCCIHVGGGVRTVEEVHQLLDCGAEKVILSSRLFWGGQIDVSFAKAVVAAMGRERLIFAIDCRGTTVMINGWKQGTKCDVFTAAQTLGPYCGELLFTCIEREGTMQGPELELIEQLVAITPVPILAAGGIGSLADVEAVVALGAGVVLGMSLYTGKISVEKLLTMEGGWDSA